MNMTNAQRTFLATAFLCCGIMASFASEQLSRIWSDPNIDIGQRMQAVDRAFTNGTPISVVVASLGTNYTRGLSSFRAPPERWFLRYKFGEESVLICTSAGPDEDPLSARFIGAGC